MRVKQRTTETDTCDVCRARTPEAHRQDTPITEDSVSLLSSPSLPRAHSRPYTPLKYSPQQQQQQQQQQGSDSLCSARPERAEHAQHRVSTNALWEVSPLAQNGRLHVDRLSLSSSDSSGDERKQPMPEPGPSREGKHPKDRNGSRQRQRRRRHRNVQNSHGSMELAVLGAETEATPGTHAPGFLQGSMHQALHASGAAVMPSRGMDSIDWVSESSAPIPQRHHPPEHSSHHAGRLLQELEHARAAELHYLVRTMLPLCQSCSAISLRFRSALSSLRGGCREVV